jgi:hypothetical protein
MQIAGEHSLVAVGVRGQFLGVTLDVFPLNAFLGGKGGIVMG